MTWPAFWHHKTLPSRLLQPLALAYSGVSRWHERRLYGQREQLAVPVIVVGNIVVGGTGKTPFIHWLITALQSWGHQPGIVSRGYGGAVVGPHLVNAQDTAESVGDEPLMLSRHTGVPVSVGRDRLAAAKNLLTAHPELTVIVSDDGLQHQRLPRSLEICLFDGSVGAGNGQLLPAGPLREPLSRLDSVDLVVAKGQAVELGHWSDQQVVMTLRLEPPTPINADYASTPPPEPNAHSGPVAALCGIGQPESFFQLLRQAGWTIEPFALADHGKLNAELRQKLAGRNVLMTSKDAVKLANEPLPFAAWEVALTVTLSAEDSNRLQHLVNTRVPTIQPQPTPNNRQDAESDNE